MGTRIAGVSSCVFCEIVAGTRDAHVVVDDDVVSAFLDARPLFPGHVLVIPRIHYETLLDVPAEVHAPLLSQVQRLAQAMETGLGAAGSFVAVNNRISQSVPHLHFHVVPRNRRDGLRGFFWPRQKYRDDEEAAETASRLRDALAE